MSTMAFTWMILARGPLFAGMSTYVVPLIALTWGALDHEVISTQQMAAIAGVLAMVALVQSGARPATEVVAADAGAAVAIGEGFVTPIGGTVDEDVSIVPLPSQPPERVVTESLAG
jgi:hypothetical protein